MLKSVAILVVKMTFDHSSVDQKSLRQGGILENRFFAFFGRPNKKLGFRSKFLEAADAGVSLISKWIGRITGFAIFGFAKGLIIISENLDQAAFSLARFQANFKDPSLLEICFAAWLHVAKI